MELVRVLPFTLLSIPELKVIRAYDFWNEKKNYSEVTMGVVRTTDLIDNPAQMVDAL